jgi:glycosyltransferase involved in cell wall biosynthesis
MPCHNGAPFINQALDSALAQTYPDVEVIVVDDGSTDGSQAIVSSYGERVQLLRRAKRGPFPARNAGLRAATGEFVAFLDADDYWREDCLAALHAALTANDADVAYCGWQNVGRGPRGGEPFVPPKYEACDSVVAFLRTCPWPIHAALTRRRVIDAVDGFSERRFSAMDYDLWIRILAVTRRIVLVPEVMAFYRWHDEGQISKVRWRQTLDAWTVRRDFVRANPELVAHLDATTRRRLVDGPVLAAAYDAYWQRDLDSAQRLFRKSLACRVGGWRDVRYLLPSLLPQAVYRALVAAADRRSTTGAPT